LAVYSFDYVVKTSTDAYCLRQAIFLLDDLIKLSIGYSDVRLISKLTRALN